VTSAPSSSVLSPAAAAAGGGDDSNKQHDGHSTKNPDKHIGGGAEQTIVIRRPWQRHG